MPINPTTLKALIDTEITNETVDFAITPAEVGGRMKDCVDYTTEQSALKENLTNKSTDVATDGSSNTKYPSVKSVKDYADGLVVGLLDDRGNYDASTNLFPATGGSGGAGAILTGDLWFISVGGTLGGVSVPIGASVRALVDTPAQTSANWSVLNVGIGFTPENVVNKSIDVTTDGASDTKYPSVKAVKTYVDANSGGLNFVSVDSNSFNGNGTPSTPLKNKVYYRTSQIYASGGGSINRVKNFFSGMQLPDGITETFSRVSSGIYRATYSGADTITDLDLTNSSKLFHFSFSSMPTNTGSDLKIQQIGSTNSAGVRTIFVEFHNLPSGVLTDNFNGYLYYEVKFFQ